jgi:hypothetical protein
MRASILSKLNSPVTDPTTAITLTAVRTAEPPYAAGPHATVVADVHVVLPHMSATPRDALGVTTNPPKPRPPIVMVPPPVAPTFDGLLMLTHGAATATKQRCELRREPMRRRPRVSVLHYGRGARARTIEAELTKHSTHHRTHTHRCPQYGRAAISLRGTCDRRCRGPRCATARLRRV